MKMLKPHHFCFSLVLTLLLPACGDRMSQADRNAARQGQANQEIKKVNEADILDAAFERGKTIADIIEGSESLENISLAINPLVDSLTQQYSAIIRKVSLELMDSLDVPDQVERVLLDAYQYSLDNGIDIEDNIQEDGKDYLLFTRPILAEIEGEENEGQQLIDFHGMWSIRLLKKEIVNSL